MMLTDAHTVRAFADLLINLSAAWFGAAFLGISLLDLTSTAGALNLLTHIIFGILSLVAAIRLRRTVPLL